MEVVTTSDSLATGDERRLGGQLGLVAGRPRRLGEVERAPLCTARLCRRRSRRRDIITCGRARGSWRAVRSVLDFYAPSWRTRVIFLIRFTKSKRGFGLYIRPLTRSQIAVCTTTGAWASRKHRTHTSARDVSGVASVQLDHPHSLGIEYATVARGVCNFWCAWRRSRRQRRRRRWTARR